MNNYYFNNPHVSQSSQIKQSLPKNNELTLVNKMRKNKY